MEGKGGVDDRVRYEGVIIILGDDHDHVGYRSDGHIEW